MHKCEWWPRRIMRQSMLPRYTAYSAQSHIEWFIVLSCICCLAALHTILVSLNSRIRLLTGIELSIRSSKQTIQFCCRVCRYGLWHLTQYCMMPSNFIVLFQHTNIRTYCNLAAKKPVLILWLNNFHIKFILLQFKATDSPVITFRILRPIKYILGKQLK